MFYIKHAKKSNVFYVLFSIEEFYQVLIVAFYPLYFTNSRYAAHSLSPEVIPEGFADSVPRWFSSQPSAPAE